jgi:hypothetical protein
MTADEATARLPKEAGIASYGEREEIAEWTAFLVSPGARWMTLRMDCGRVDLSAIPRSIDLTYRMRQFATIR